MNYTNNRVCCLYRVSTDKQVDFNANHEADIPMQRKACHRFAEAKGWVIVHEEQEEGISGHKVRAEARDKIQIIKELAKQGKFDILLVFMFDRIGRIADETPFVVEWFVRNGVHVWSTQEGEQRFDNHTDKLLNYIRFWQADGESEKTSVRTRTSLRQLVEEGYFKGGNAPYGYDLVKSGRVNKRKHELLHLQINQEEAAVVRLIFDKYVNEGYGAQRIATFLNDQGYRARSGKCWHHASIRGIICNLTYTGILRCGDARSERLPELQIISQEQFDTAQKIRTARANYAAENHPVPLNTRGKSLLSGNVYCGHCGAKLALTTNNKYVKNADGSITKIPRIRYICYGKTRRQTECDGQTGYTMHILDGIIDKLIHQLFAAMKGIPRNELITERYQEELAERKAHLTALETEYRKALADTDALKSEVLACIRGESAFSKEMLAEMLSQQEEACNALLSHCEEARAALEQTEDVLAELSSQYDELISYAQLYDSATFEAKKMIVNQLIQRVDVRRNYQISVKFNFQLGQLLGDSALEEGA
jgi:DNA invertase Pin-like site-specific DNA recombinase